MSLPAADKKIKEFAKILLQAKQLNKLYAQYANTQNEVNITHTRDELLSSYTRYLQKLSEFNRNNTETGKDERYKDLFNKVKETVSLVSEEAKFTILLDQYMVNPTAYNRYLVEEQITNLNGKSTYVHENAVLLTIAELVSEYYEAEKDRLDSKDSNSLSLKDAQNIHWMIKYLTSNLSKTNPPQNLKVYEGASDSDVDQFDVIIDNFKAKYKTMYSYIMALSSEKEAFDAAHADLVLTSEERELLASEPSDPEAIANREKALKKFLKYHDAYAAHAKSKSSQLSAPTGELGKIYDKDLDTATNNVKLIKELEAKYEKIEYIRYTYEELIKYANFDTFKTEDRYLKDETGLDKLDEHGQKIKIGTKEVFNLSDIEKRKQKQIEIQRNYIAKLDQNDPATVSLAKLLNLINVISSIVSSMTIDPQFAYTNNPYSSDRAATIFEGPTGTINSRETYAIKTINNQKIVPTETMIMQSGANKRHKALIDIMLVRLDKLHQLADLTNAFARSTVDVEAKVGKTDDNEVAPDADEKDKIMSSFQRFIDKFEKLEKAMNDNSINKETTLGDKNIEQDNDFYATFKYTYELIKNSKSKVERLKEYLDLLEKIEELKPLPGKSKEEEALKLIDAYIDKYDRSLGSDYYNNRTKPDSIVEQYRDKEKNAYDITFKEISILFDINKTIGKNNEGYLADHYISQKAYSGVGALLTTQLSARNALRRLSIDLRAYFSSTEKLVSNAYLNNGKADEKVINDYKGKETLFIKDYGKPLDDVEGIVWNNQILAALSNNYNSLNELKEAFGHLQRIIEINKEYKLVVDAYLRHPSKENLQKVLSMQPGSYRLRLKNEIDWVNAKIINRTDLTATSPISPELIRLAKDIVKASKSYIIKVQIVESLKAAAYSTDLSRFDVTKINLGIDSLSDEENKVNLLDLIGVDENFNIIKDQVGNYKEDSLYDYATSFGGSSIRFVLWKLSDVVTDNPNNPELSAFTGNHNYVKAFTLLAKKSNILREQGHEAAGSREALDELEKFILALNDDPNAVDENSPTASYNEPIDNKDTNFERVLHARYLSLRKTFELVESEKAYLLTNDEADYQKILKVTEELKIWRQQRNPKWKEINKFLYDDEEAIFATLAPLKDSLEALKNYKNEPTTDNLDKLNEAISKLSEAAENVKKLREQFKDDELKRFPYENNLLTDKILAKVEVLKASAEAIRDVNGFVDDHSDAHSSAAIVSLEKLRQVTENLPENAVDKGLYKQLALAKDIADLVKIVNDAINKIDAVDENVEIKLEYALTQLAKFKQDNEEIYKEKLFAVMADKLEKELAKLEAIYNHYLATVNTYAQPDSTNKDKQNSTLEKIDQVKAEIKEEVKLLANDALVMVDIKAQMDEYSAKSTVDANREAEINNLITKLKADIETHKNALYGRAENVATALEKEIAKVALAKIKHLENEFNLVKLANKMDNEAKELEDKLSKKAKLLEKQKAGEDVTNELNALETEITDLKTTIKQTSDSIDSEVAKSNTNKNELINSLANFDVKFNENNDVAGSINVIKDINNAIIEQQEKALEGIDKTDKDKVLDLQKQLEDLQNNETIKAKLGTKLDTLKAKADKLVNERELFDSFINMAQLPDKVHKEKFDKARDAANKQPEEGDNTSAQAIFNKTLDTYYNLMSQRNYPDPLTVEYAQLVKENGKEFIKEVDKLIEIYNNEATKGELSQAQKQIIDQLKIAKEIIDIETELIANITYAALNPSVENVQLVSKQAATINAKVDEIKAKYNDKYDAVLSLALNTKKDSEELVKAQDNSDDKILNALEKALIKTRGGKALEAQEVANLKRLEQQVPRRQDNFGLRKALTIDIDRAISESDTIRQLNEFAKVNDKEFAAKEIRDDIERINQNLAYYNDLLAKEGISDFEKAEAQEQIASLEAKKAKKLAEIEHIINEGIDAKNQAIDELIRVEQEKSAQIIGVYNDEIARYEKLQKDYEDKIKDLDSQIKAKEVEKEQLETLQNNNQAEIDKLTNVELPAKAKEVKDAKAKWISLKEKREEIERRLTTDPSNLGLQKALEHAKAEEMKQKESLDKLLSEQESLIQNLKAKEANAKLIAKSLADTESAISQLKKSKSDENAHAEALDLTNRVNDLKAKLDETKKASEKRLNDYQAIKEKAQNKDEYISDALIEVLKETQQNLPEAHVATEYAQMLDKIHDALNKFTQNPSEENRLLVEKTSAELNKKRDKFNALTEEEKAKLPQTIVDLIKTKEEQLTVKQIDADLKAALSESADNLDDKAKYTDLVNKLAKAEDYYANMKDPKDQKLKETIDLANKLKESLSSLNNELDKDNINPDLDSINDDIHNISKIKADNVIAQAIKDQALKNAKKAKAEIEFRISITQNANKEGELTENDANDLERKIEAIKATFADLNNLSESEQALLNDALKAKKVVSLIAQANKEAKDYRAKVDQLADTRYNDPKLQLLKVEVEKAKAKYAQTLAELKAAVDDLANAQLRLINSKSEFKPEQSKYGKESLLTRSIKDATKANNNMAFGISHTKYILELAKALKEASANNNANEQLINKLVNEAENVKDRHDKKDGEGKHYGAKKPNAQQLANIAKLIQKQKEGLWKLSKKELEENLKTFNQVYDYYLDELIQSELNDIAKEQIRLIHREINARRGNLIAIITTAAISSVLVISLIAGVFSALKNRKKNKK
ncbi:coiled-coil domain-containing protein [Mycoplasmopsis opalescens]|uniref:hypothetical protein n=1 Tax=Mycoplasmopsis opalescens TaxID=114886 RepID=UPI0004A74B4E|nr:hypothetical protein [Mycoplasmopsis opalescens]